MAKYHQVKDAYSLLKNPSKYKGTRPLTTRSSWELSFIIKYLDVNVNIIEWGSETVIVKYFNPLKNRNARYYMDFNFFANDKNGNLKEFWIEIKPFAETFEPKKPKRITKSHKYKIESYITNNAKWEATEVLCESLRSQGRDVTFLKITEKDCPFFLK